MQNKLNLQGSRMKKLMWFTKDQMDLLEEIKTVTGYGNSQIVRKAMQVYADKLGINFADVDTVKV